MAGRLSRANSLIRGSGHSLQGAKNVSRDSILKPRRGSRRNSIHGQTVYDLILLSTVSEETVCENLKELFMNDIIYSYIGNVVVAINPFADLPIYGQDYIDKYRGRSAFDPKLQPHIFALSDNVFNDLRFRGRDQVVIISGESGAGKTESSKKIMQYVAAVSGSTDQVNKVKSKLLKTNPVLEAFGNAKTNRNDNSSRFGKYMDLQFDFSGEPGGGHITTYLLEKARVVRQGEGERNFHIFYQLLAGAASQLGLDPNPASYYYLHQGDADKVKGMNDLEWFREMQDGLKFVGFSDDNKMRMFEILGAILLFGQLTFKAAKGGGSAVENMPSLLPKLLGTDAASIEKALTHSTVVVNKQSVASDLSPAQALDARDTLAKAMYDRLFSWVCNKINENIASKTPIKAVIGVLDIYGFEIFKNNSFEQFCINYCNEKLQQLFIELTLKTEQDEYLAEGIAWTPIEYFNNKIICDLVEEKPRGIVALLDEESIRPGEKSDRVWLEKMNTVLNTHKHYKSRAGPQDRSLPEDTFKLIHYAGEVIYNVNGFLEKNTDTLFKDLSRLMFTSKNEILKAQFPEGDEATWLGAAKRPPTAGRSFVTSMNQMIEILNTKIPSYVRCIKPNQKKMSKKIEDELLHHQVKYLGLVENVRVRRAGFCFRETMADFFWRYKLLSPKTYPRWKGSVQDGIKQIMADMAISEKSYQLGKTKVFIKDPQPVFKLEEERDHKLDEIVRRVQLAYRLYRIRKEINSYYNELVKLFANVNKDPHLGRKVVWPKHGKVLNDAESFLKRVYMNWWARKMVLRLSPEEQQTYRLYLLAHQLFHKQKQSFSLKTIGFKSTYVQSDHPGLQVLLGVNGPALFHCEVTKINRKGVPQRRFLFLTSRALFKADEQFKVTPKRIVGLGSIKSVSISKFRDNVVVIHSHNPGQDHVLLVGVDKNYACEFVIRLYLALREMNIKLPVNIVDSIAFNNSNKPTGGKNMTFQEHPAGANITQWYPKTNVVWY